MGSLRKFAQLDRRDKRLLLRVLVVVAAVRVALWVLPFGTLRKLMSHFANPRGSRPAVAPHRLVWAVTAASRRIPSATCLTQALALHLLCRRRGWPTQLQIGVARSNGAFRAHAWVEHGGEILIGEPASPNAFTPLPSVGL
jgi:transglutaminase superfamily protein